MTSRVRKNNERRWAKKHATGKICSKHPELGGKRYCYVCVGCLKTERKRYDSQITRRDRRNKQRRDWWVKLKRKVIEAYGGKCKICGESDIDMLTLDHIRNDGAAHRRELGSNYVYRDVEKRGFPKGFQVLCANHNLKRHLVWARRRFRTRR